MMRDDDDDDNTAAAITSVNGDDDTTDVEQPVHDQLPTVEEYKSQRTSDAHDSARMEEISGAFEQNENDDDEPVHDQLPSVNEAKANAGLNLSGQQKFCRCTSTVVVVVLILIAIIIPAVVVTRNNRSESSRVNEVTNYLADLGVSDLATMKREGTPQHNAVLWIADFDGYNLEIPKDPPLEGAKNSFVERYVLTVFYFASGGVQWTHQMNFLTPQDHCNWNQPFATDSGAQLLLGVNSCKALANTNEKFVSVLGLLANNLVGTFPKELAFLNSLEVYVGQFNPGMTGKFPEGFRTLPSLKHVELQYNTLTGTIPDWIGSKGALTTLGLGNNLFTGDVPSSIANLDKLRILGLDDNALGGNIEIFKPLTKLQSLYLEDNFFRGELTSQMMSFWDQLEELDLSNNDLTSQLPSNMFNSDKLQVIDLNGNRMIGTLPNVPSKNTALQFLSLWNNTLTGAIPASLENLEGLQHLDISLNYFSSYPDSLQQMTALKYFFMGSNEFTEAPFPQSILQLSNLEELSLKDCKLTGAIPSAIGQLTKLRLLDLDTNKFSGEIPDEMSQLTNLDALLLNNNELIGGIPVGFDLLTNLYLLVVDNNNLDGNADAICLSELDVLNFMADCGDAGEFRCECCTECCNDNNTECNNFAFHGNLDPIWEYGFNRGYYVFSNASAIERATEP